MTTPTLREALLPCPFCGAEAEILDLDEGENAGGSCVSCKRCLASSNVEFGRKENFVSNWNRRAALSAPQPSPNAPGELVALQAWCDERASQIGAVDGYDYRSGEEAAYRHVSLEIEKRLRTAAAPSMGEPVGYRWRNNFEPWWHYGAHRLSITDEGRNDPKFEEQPLYPHPPAAAGAPGREALIEHGLKIVETCLNKEGGDLYIDHAGSRSALKLANAFADALSRTPSSAVTQEGVWSALELADETLRQVQKTYLCDDSPIINLTREKISEALASRAGSGAGDEGLRLQGMESIPADEAATLAGHVKGFDAPGPSDPAPSEPIEQLIAAKMQEPAFKELAAAWPLREIGLLPIFLLGPTAVSHWRVETLTGRELLLSDDDWKSAKRPSEPAVAQQSGVTDQQRLDLARAVYAATGGQPDDRRRAQKVSRIQLAIEYGSDGVLSNAALAPLPPLPERGPDAATVEALEAAKPLLQYLEDIEFNLRRQPKPDDLALHEHGERIAQVTWREFNSFRNAIRASQRSA